MGFSISGIAIDKNLQNEIEDFFIVNGFKATTTNQEIEFLDAMDSYKGSSYADVCYSDHGTIIFIDQKISMRTYRYKNCDTLTFEYHESVMAFYINYLNKGIPKRLIMMVNNEVDFQEGPELAVEIENQGDLSGAIPSLIESMTGIDIFATDEELCVRFIISPIKKWWQFWK